MLKNKRKIRKLLNRDKYYLCTDNFGNWELFKHYEKFDEYMSSYNKPIMTNRSHTEKELLKFAKKHREYNIYDLSKILTRILISLMWISLFVSFFVKEFVYVNLTIDFITLIFLVVDYKIFNQNYRVFDLELQATLEEIDNSLKIVHEKLKKGKQ